MFKKVLQGVIMGGALLGLVGTATAAEYNINLYGASAQHLYWTNAADDFLSGVSNSGAGKPNCSDVINATRDSKNGITRGTGCLGDNSTFYIRYSSKASFDGILALQGNDDYAATTDKCNEGDPGVETGMAKYYRKMVNETSCNWTTGACSSTACKRVILGASDVEGAAFNQYTLGQLNGHAGGGEVERNFLGGIPTEGLAFDTPLAVPFGFFANVDSGVTVTSLTTAQARFIFSGQIENLQVLNPAFPSKTIISCFRHAGSGTHATIDAAVMRGDATLPQFEEPTGPPRIWFNDGSSQMMACVNTNGGQGQGSAWVAFGYADADQANSCGTGKTYANTKPLQFEGVTPNHDATMNSAHNFWSNQHIYWDPTVVTGNLATHVNNLLAFAADASKMPSAQKAYWVTQNELKSSKENSFTWPTWK